MIDSLRDSWQGQPSGNESGVEGACGLFSKIQCSTRYPFARPLATVLLSLGGNNELLAPTKAAAVIGALITAAYTVAWAEANRTAGVYKQRRQCGFENANFFSAQGSDGWVMTMG